MSFLMPLARAAVSVAGKGRLSAFMLGKGMANNEEKKDEQPKSNFQPMMPTTPTLKDITGPAV
jgi:hypothetical protein